MRRSCAARRGESGAAGLQQKLQEARWLIKNIQQRFDTILRVSQAIVERQKNFFTHGEIAMRPLVLREIADTLGLHESTISRVTTNKYMATPMGTFELKYFFGSHVSTRNWWRGFINGHSRLDQATYRSRRPEESSFRQPNCRIAG
ncbi:hypothetical protein ACTMU2_36635 [Cupriavidus basilensis]